MTAIRRSVVPSVAFALAMLAAGSCAGASSEVSGGATVDGTTIPLSHAYLDRTDPTEPIVVLTDQALPAEAVPFVPEKLVKEKGLTAVAFSYSAKDGKLTNTYGRLQCPGHESGVGLGRVEDGNVALVVRRFDDSGIEGTLSTPKPVKLSFITYSFDLKFRARN